MQNIISDIDSLISLYGLRFSLYINIKAISLNHTKLLTGRQYSIISFAVITLC